MSRAFSAVLVTVSTLSAASAHAYQTAPVAARNALDAQAAYAERLQRQALDGPTERAPFVDPDQNPRRARRAEAAAALINSGDCDGALALAERERDQRLAARIGLVCASVSVSAPTSDNGQATSGGSL